MKGQQRTCRNMPLGSPRVSSCREASSPGVPPAIMVDVRLATKLLPCRGTHGNVCHGIVWLFLGVLVKGRGGGHPPQTAASTQTLCLPCSILCGNLVNSEKPISRGSLQKLVPDDELPVQAKNFTEPH